MLENLTPKELYELRRQEKKEQRQTDAPPASTGPRRRFSAWYWLIGILVLIVIGLVWLMSAAKPQGLDLSRGAPIQNRDHISVGATHPSYNSNPPTSGWHYGDTAPTGFHQTPIADEYIIHNLEHGDIWISYQPEISEEIKNTLKGFAGPYVIITPREANETDIALVAWGRLDTFDTAEFTPERVRDFIKRYDNQGPEKVRTATPN